MTNIQYLKLVLWLANYYADRDMGEEGGNNTGPDVWLFRHNDGTGKRIKTRGNWCASFGAACFVLTSKWMQHLLPFETSRGAKRLAKNIGKAGVFIDAESKDERVLMSGMVGGAIAWHRGLPGSWQGHFGLWYKYDLLTDTLHTIEGNKRGKVRRCKYPNGTWRKRLAVVSTL